jgi:hypothetical protein
MLKWINAAVRQLELNEGVGILNGSYSGLRCRLILKHLEKRRLLDKLGHDGNTHRYSFAG